MRKQKVTPFLSFTGKAEEAMQFYFENMPDTTITKLVRYGKGHPFALEGEENFVLYGEINLMGTQIKFLDMSTSYPAPDFSFATSLYIDCVNEAEFDEIFKALSKEGSVMMGPEPVGDLRKCAWVKDKFGVTWQPVLE